MCALILAGEKIDTTFESGRLLGQHIFRISTLSKICIQMYCCQLIKILPKYFFYYLSNLSPVLTQAMGHLSHS